jgi:hypothetical protein
MDAVVINQDLDNKKCYSCGKNFRTPADLIRHKNRKTPCLIREVPQNQIDNPNRCIYCNKILSKKEHLTRHITTCKIKNGGMEILVDKVRHEQEIRIMKEQIAMYQVAQQQAEARAVAAEQKAQQRDEMLIKTIQDMNKKIDQFTDKKIEPIIQQGNTTTNVNAPVNIDNSTNNIVNAPTINVNINSYLAPDISSIKITVDELLKTDGNFYKFILEKVYFNPGLPENHSVYVPNKKEKDLIVYDNCWEYIREDGKLYEVVKQIVDTIHKSGTVLQGQLHDILDYHDVKFLKLPPAIQYMFSQFNSLKFEGEETLYDTAISRRDIVGPTIKESGCKLIK